MPMKHSGLLINYIQQPLVATIYPLPTAGQMRCTTM